ncbi:unnamed protein product [Caenorhabditis angaria]|uniref:Serpentine Receptor, class H n=1 Tax=Caenorhabditis angaria TaxID=860376 RepID=A0A9P1IWF6_9PELO|nr:unnamed protein product [Caenorhabditis angaria]
MLGLESIFGVLSILLLCIFENRHNAMTSISFRFQTKFQKCVFYLANFIFQITLFVLNLPTDIDTEKNKLDILKNIINCPDPLFFKSSTHLITLQPFQVAAAILICLMVIGIQGTFFVLHSVYHLIFFIDTRVSKQTRSLQKIFIRNLLIQVITPLTIVGIPLFITIACTFLGYQSQVLACHTFLALGTHGTIGSLALIFSHYDYRQYTLKLFRCSSKVHLKPTIETSFVI